ncbi:hypothetical protein [Pseudodesulfovibrio tunisiensis]|nr:hypothetical protein [Pseudodesulfovibrio tunisiensis]
MDQIRHALDMYPEWDMASEELDGYVRVRLTRREPVYSREDSDA